MFVDLWRRVWHRRIAQISAREMASSTATSRCLNIRSVPALITATTIYCGGIVTTSVMSCLLRGINTASKPISKSNLKFDVDVRVEIVGDGDCLLVKRLDAYRSKIDHSGPCNDATKLIVK